MKNELQKLWEKCESECDCSATSLLPDELLCEAVERVFPAGSVIVNAGDFPEFIYFVLSGTVRGVKLFENGEYYQYFSLGVKNGGIGLLELFAHESAFVATIVATSEVRALVVRSERYLEYALKSNDLLRLNLQYISHDLYKSSAKDGLLFYKDGESRVKYFLIDYYLSESVGENKKVTVLVDYESVAVTLGLSVRTVGRSVKKLLERGLVGKTGRRLTITREQYDRLSAEYERQ